MLTDAEKIRVREFFVSLYGKCVPRKYSVTSKAQIEAEDKMKENALSQVDAIIRVLAKLTWHQVNFWLTSLSDEFLCVSHRQIAVTLGHSPEVVDSWISEMVRLFSEQENEHIKSILLAFIQRPESNADQPVVRNG